MNLNFCGYRRHFPSFCRAEHPACTSISTELLLIWSYSTASAVTAEESFTGKFCLSGTWLSIRKMLPSSELEYDAILPLDLKYCTSRSRRYWFVLLDPQRFLSLLVEQLLGFRPAATHSKSFRSVSGPWRSPVYNPLIPSETCPQRLICDFKSRLLTWIEFRCFLWSLFFFSVEVKCQLKPPFSKLNLSIYQIYQSAFPNLTCCMIGITNNFFFSIIFKLAYNS